MVTSTYYFDRMSEAKGRPVEEDLVIACSPQLVSMKLGILVWEASYKKEIFVPMPPDMLATSARLTLDRRLPGVSPDTGRFMAMVEPEEWKRPAIDARTKISEHFGKQPPTNAADFSALAAKVSNASITIIKPEK